MGSVDDEGDKVMEIVVSDGKNGHASPSVEGKELIAIPVAGGSSGEGLPYAPEDWPSPGDKWRWKVGNRKAASGHWIDRCLIAPSSCPRFMGNKPGFQSKVSVEQYIRKEFPNADVNAFFSLFIWKVRACDSSQKVAPSISLGFIDPIKAESEPASGGCKAGNLFCCSLTKLADDCLIPKDCNICCSEAGFCRDCCCILCSQIIETTTGGYSFIRCEAAVNENFICGHRAHLECALRCYMAGTVGGSIGLDLQYYCRRCDSKTDLMPHVTKLLKVCESIDSRDDAEKVLKLGFCILRYTEQIGAKSLRIRIGLAISKLKRGVHLDEIWKVEADGAALTGDKNHNGNYLMTAEDTAMEGIEFNCVDKVEPLRQIELASGDNGGFITSDREGLAAKLEERIDQALQELRRSQALEYQNAEEKLHSQKDIIVNLYKQLDSNRFELANRVASTGGKSDASLSRHLRIVEQIKREEEKLTKMMKVADRFLQTPR